MVRRLCVLGAVVGLGILLASAPVSGQQPPPTEPTREQPAREGERLPTLTSPGPPITAYPLELLGLLAPPARRGPITLVPSIAVSGEYDDNVFLDNRNKQADFIGAFSPALTLVVNKPSFELSAGYSFTAEIYADQSHLSGPFNSQFFLGSALFRLSPRLTLTLSDYFVNDRNTNITSQGATTGRQESWSNSFSPGLAWQASPRNTLSLGATHTVLRYLGGGGGLDSDTYSFQTALGHAFTPRLTGSIGYGFTYIDQLNEGEDSTTHSPNVGLSYRVTENLTASVSGGPAITEIDGETFITPAGTASLTQAFRWGSMGIRYTRGVSVAGGFGGTTDTQTISGSVGVTSLLQGLILAFSPSYITSESVSSREGEQVDVQTFTLTLSAMYQIARYASVFAGYTFLHQRTGGSSSQQVDADQNRVRFGLQFGYPFNFD
jgi:hypothetical protein